MKNRFIVAVLVAFALVLTLPQTAGAQDDEVVEIESDGAGDLRVGRTVDQLRTDVDGDLSISEEIEIFPGQPGFAVNLDGAIYALLVPNESSGVIEHIIFVNRAYQTAEGVGPQSTLAAARAAYGDVSLEWFPDDRGQEVATFAGGPEGLTFFTSDAGGPRAGVYDDDATTTDVTKPGAAITTVMVSCADDPCGLDDGAATAAPADDADDSDGASDDGDDADAADGTDEADADADDADASDADDADAADTDDLDDAGDDPEASDDADDTGDDAAGELPNTGGDTRSIASLGLSMVGAGCAVLFVQRRRN